MLSALLGVFGTIFGWLGNLLPDSPLRGFAVATEQMQLGLSWLNWFLPISEMLVMLGLWIAALLVVTAVKVALRTVGGIGGKVAGDA